MSEKQWSLESLVVAHRKVALDANVLIYLLADVGPQASLAAAVIDAIDGPDLLASMATVGEVEVLAGPARAGDGAAFERAAERLGDIGLELVPLTSTIAADAAWLRGRGGLRLADAIHVASARAVQATAMVTNDRGITSRPGLQVYYLEDLRVQPPPGKSEPSDDPATIRP